MTNEKPTGQKATLSLLQIVGYGAGSMFSLTLAACIAGYMLMPFLTNVAGFSTVAAASIYSITSIIRIITMAVSGIAVDGISFKTGKFRTWILIGGFVTVLSSFMFYNFDLSEGAYIIVFLILFAVNQLGYNFAWTSSRALVGPLSKNSADGIALTTSNQIGSKISTTLYGLISAPLFAAFAASSHPYFGPMLIFCFVTLAGSVLLFVMTKNYDKPEFTKVGETKQKTEKISLIEMFKSLTGQGLIFMGATILGNIQSGFFATLLYYYTAYVLKNAYITGLAVTFNSIGGVVGALCAPIICRKLSKKTVYQLAHFASAALYFMVFLFGKSAVAFLALRAVLGFFGAFSGITLPALANDLSDYNEMNNLSHARGFIQSTLGVAIRVGSMISATISSFGLVFIGFDAKVEVTEKVTTGIAALLGIAPAIVCVLSAIVMMFFKVDEKELDIYRMEKAAKNN